MTNPFNDAKMLSLIRASAPRLRAEVEDIARSRCDRYFRSRPYRHSMPGDDEAVLRAEIGRAAKEVFMREIQPLQRQLVRIMAARMPRFTCLLDAKNLAIEVLPSEDGLTSELRAVVVHIEACMNEYAAIFYGPPAADKDGTPTRRTS